MMNTSLNLAALPKCNYEVMYLDSAVLIPCVEYQRELRDEKIHSIAANFSEYIANEPKVSWRGGRYYVFDGQNTIEARKACNGGMDLPILCKVFTGLTKEDEAILFAVQTGFSTELTAGERLRADLVAQDPDALAFAAATNQSNFELALDGIQGDWRIYCIRAAQNVYHHYGPSIYMDTLDIIADAWKGDVDSLRSGILWGVSRFIALYQEEYDAERLIQRLHTVHPKTIIKLAREDTGGFAERHMRQILEVYNGSSRTHCLPEKP